MTDDSLKYFRDEGRDIQNDMYIYEYIFAQFYVHTHMSSMLEQAICHERRVMNEQRSAPHAE